MPVLAIAAIAIEVIITALMAILLTYALELFARAVAQLVPGFSIPGLGSLRDKINQGITSAIDAVRSIVSSSLAPMVNLFRDSVIFFQGMYNIIYSTINEVVTTGSWIINTGLPRIYQLSVGYTNSMYNQSIAFTLSAAGQIRSYAESLYNQAIAHANDLYNQVHAFAIAEATAAWNHADDLARQITGNTAALYQQAIGYTNSMYNKAIGYAQNAATLAWNHADDLARQITATTAGLFAQSLAHATAAAAAAEVDAIAAVTGPLITDLPGIWPGLVDSIDGVIDTAAGDFTDAIAGIKGLDLTIPISIGGALAVTIPAISALTRLANDCTIPNCRNLSQVGRDLQALFSLVEDGLLFAFIAELVHDPAGGVSLVEDTLGELANEAVNVGKTLIGV